MSWGAQKYLFVFFSYAALFVARSFLVNAAVLQSNDVYEILDEAAVSNSTTALSADVVIDQSLAHDVTPLVYVALKTVTKNSDIDKLGRRLLPTMENGGVVFFLHVVPHGYSCCSLLKQ